MIEEGCDVGVIAGTLTDEAVIARRAGRIVRYPVASAEFLRARSAPREPGDLAGWPWLALASSRFGGPREETFWSLMGRRRVRIKPVLISEGVTSLREAARAGLGVAVLPEWLIGEDLVSGRLQRVLPAWQARDLAASIVYPVQRRLPARVRAFVDHAAAYMATCLKGDGTDGLR